MSMLQNGSTGGGTRYRLLPFRFMRFDAGKLLVNLGGQFLVLSNDEFDRFLSGTLDATDEAFLDLKAKHFLADGKIDLGPVKQ